MVLMANVQGKAEMKSDFDVAAVAAAHHGVVSRQLLRDAGLTNQRIDRWLRSARIRTIGPGVYRVFESEGDMWLISAAVLSIKESAADMHTAASIHGLSIPRPGLPQIVVRRSGTNRSGLARVRQTGHLPTVDICVASGVRSLTVARTVCELVPIMSAGASERLVTRALSQTSLTESELMACDASLARRGRPGVQSRRQRLAPLLTGESVDLSALERLFLLKYQTTMFPLLAVQFRPPWFEGTDGIVDFRIEGYRILIELDGRAWHSSVDARIADVRRDRRADRHGWRVVRFSWDEVVHRWGEVIDHLEFVLNGADEETGAG